MLASLIVLDAAALAEPSCVQKNAVEFRYNEVVYV